MSQSTTSSSLHSIHTCNKLLQDERSAVQTYTKVIRRFRDEPAIDKLTALRHDHRLAVHDLELEISHIGGEPIRETHPWRRIRSLIDRSDDLWGDDSAVEALQKVEHRILDDYRQSLQEEDLLLPKCRRLCCARLIPLTASHIDALEDLERDSDCRFIPVY